ncbi:MAG: CoA-binding protein [Deltaproteobacteria bacterium]
MKNSSKWANGKAGEQSGLKSVLDPQSVAVIGASTTFGKWGQFILSNIVAGGFEGKIFPVNPREVGIQ